MRITAEDTVIATPNFAGLRTTGGIHDGLLLSNFVAQSIPSGSRRTRQLHPRGPRGRGRHVHRNGVGGAVRILGGSDRGVQGGGRRGDRARPRHREDTRRRPSPRVRPAATYTITATNSGLVASAGTVTVTDVLPAGLTRPRLSGPGWNCTLATLKCTRADALAAGDSYPPIAVTVTVAGNAPSSVTNVATVSGGGEVNSANNSASDVTAVGTFSVSPATAVLSPAQVQQFTVVSAGTPEVIWLVDGIVGGSADRRHHHHGRRIHGAVRRGQPHHHGQDQRPIDLRDRGDLRVGVFGHVHLPQRQRQDRLESADPLAPATVSPATFGTLASYAIDGVGTASPLYVPGVEIPGLGTRDVVFVATQHASLYAFDADGVETAPLWHVSFINPGAGITPVLEGDVGCCDAEVGIMGTPVIDPATQTIYLVAKTKENGGVVQRLHALDIRTGAEKSGSPVTITASVTGTGDGSAGGVLAFDALRQNQRPALLLSRGVVYIAWASHNDAGPYHGWVMGYDAGTLQQTMVFCATPDGGRRRHLAVEWRTCVRRRRQPLSRHRQRHVQRRTAAGATTATRSSS